MPTPSFARKTRRILTDVDEATLRTELKERLGEIDAGEVELRSEAEMWQQAFGDKISPAASTPKPPGR